MIELAIAAVAVALASAAAYLWRRQWIDAALALVAGAALAALVNGFSLPAGRGPAADAASGDIAHAAEVTVDGDGLRAAQWHDLPARPLRWSAPDTPVLRLDFPHEMVRGRIFTLAVERGESGPARLQLLAENGALLAESKGEGRTISVQWMPPIAESLVLRARLLGKDGKPVAEGPVPFRVTDNEPLRVQGRFGAPSFDAQVLARLLQQSHAVLDWRVVLGKTITRAQTSREAIARPDVVVVDAAYVERLPASARAQLMAQTASGVPLIVLGANASDRSLWQREFQLALASQPDGTETRGELKMAVPALAAQAQGTWRDGGERIATRAWQQGRITWLSLADWHRHAITQPKALALWWQQVVDAAGVRRKVDMNWLAPAEMPLAGQRLEVCATGVQGSVRFPSLDQSLEWQRRPDKAGASCVAVWPRKEGWLAMETGAKGEARSAVYVYEDQDWPMWQAAQRRDATALYAARTPERVPAGRTPLPEWPFALAFVAAMLGLWWRERR
ncbi:hypothetical protein [Pseudoduganella sp. GCM10020061]|uniref:hypothetical protein n=1 Tax=Pseudoduganella sp. GCM10020061 TaxID=3317345 RepID=UPI003624DB82